MAIVNYFIYPRPIQAPGGSYTAYFSVYAEATTSNSSGALRVTCTLSGTTGLVTYGGVTAAPSALTPGTYYLSFNWTASRPPGISLRYGIVYRNSSNAQIGSTVWTTVPTNAPARYVSPALTAPAGTAKISISWELYNNSGSGADNCWFTLDNIRLYTTNDSTYIDGTTAGNEWTGTAYASATRSQAIAVASGTTTSTGSLQLDTVPNLSGTAFGSATGSIEIYPVGTAASGTVTSTGSAALWPYGPLSADGTTSGGAQATMEVVLFAAASGTAGSGGSLTADIAILTFASGEGASTGTLDLGFPPAFSASGEGTTAGLLQVAVAGLLSASGTANSDGIADVGMATPKGAFADFALYGVTQTDPAVSIVGANNGGTQTGPTGDEWVRIWSEFTAPGDAVTASGTLWSRAAYCVPGIRFNAVPAGSWQEFTRVQVEYSQPGGPTDYMYAAALRPLVYPDRMNLWVNALNVTADPGPSYSAVSETSPIPGDTAAALRIDLQPDTNHTVSSETARLKPNAYYTLSAYVRVSGNVQDAGFAVRDVAGNLLAPLAWASASEAAEFDPDYKRLVVVFQAPSDGTCVIEWNWDVRDQTGVESFQIAGVLLEEGIELRDYFWYREGDIDYRYHYESADPSGGVFHYEDFLRKDYILKQALAESAPTGVIVENPEYAKIPHLDN